MKERRELVGRYEAGSGETRQVWTLDDDGGCRIERAAMVTVCEWHLKVSDGRALLVVRLSEAAGHTTTYVLNPRRLPWGNVTLPLGTGKGHELRKLD